MILHMAKNSKLGFNKFKFVQHLYLTIQPTTYTL